MEHRVGVSLRFPMVTATMEIIFFSGAFKDLEPDFNHSLKENKGRTWTGIAFPFEDLKGSQSGCLEDGFRHQRQWQCQKTPYPSGPAGNKMNPHGLEGNLHFLDPGRNRLMFSKCQSNHGMSLPAQSRSAASHCSSDKIVNLHDSLAWAFLVWRICLNLPSFLHIK